MRNVTCIPVFLFALGLAPSHVFAEGGSFLELQIDETKKDGDIGFAVRTAELIYLTGNRTGLYEPYNFKDGAQGKYIVEAYSISGDDFSLLSKYLIGPSRFLGRDGGHGGGIKEVNKGTLRLTIPYDVDNPIVAVRLDNGGVKTNFLPIAQSLPRKRLGLPAQQHSTAVAKPD
jgi:hypothetical protein